MCVDLIPLGDFSFFEHLYSIVVREYGTTGFWFSRMYLYLYICIKTIYGFREEKENSPRRISGRKSIRFLTKPVVSVELNIFSWEKNWEKIWEKIFLTTDA